MEATTSALLGSGDDAAVAAFLAGSTVAGLPGGLLEGEVVDLAAWVALVEGVVRNGWVGGTGERRGSQWSPEGGARAGAEAEAEAEAGSRAGGRAAVAAVAGSDEDGGDSRVDEGRAEVVGVGHSRGLVLSCVHCFPWALWVMLGVEASSM